MIHKKYLLYFVTFFSLSAFAQQYDPSLIPYRHGNLWGYANPDKSIAIKPTFNETSWFVAGFAVVKKGTKFGYINKTGKLVIPAKFYSAKPFTYGYFDDKGKHTAGGKLIKNQDTVLFAGASLTADGAEVCIDTRGLVMSKCPAINENTPGNNAPIVSVEPQKTYGMVGNGNLYDKLIDDYKLPGDDHTYYIGIKNNLYGVINNTQDVVLPFEFATVKKTGINGAAYLLVEKNNLYGMYTGAGAIFIPVEKTGLSCAKPEQGSVYFIVSKDGAATLKDVNQQDIIAGNYSAIEYEKDRGFILTGADNTKGYYFVNKKLVAPKYSEVKSVKGGNFILVKTTGGKAGYVSAEGVEYFDE